MLTQLRQPLQLMDLEHNQPKVSQYGTLTVQIWNNNTFLKRIALSVDVREFGG